MSAKLSTTCVSNVREATRKYKGVLLDQFGVLHDGKVAYPQAVEAVKQWAAEGKKVYILSNSSRRSETTLKKISSLGFPQDCFAGAMTSGEVTHRYLRDRPTAEWSGLGTRCLHFTWGARGAIDITSLGLTPVPAPRDCDFILAHGTEALGMEGGEVQRMHVQDLEALMAECAALRPNRPMIIANPDFVTVSGDELLPMPGSLGRFYASQGGQVRVMGKPSTVIYELALEDLGLAAHEVCAVGDSIEHDVAGAGAMHIDSVFVAGGIHAEHFRAEAGEVVHATDDNMQQFVQKEGLCGASIPTFTIDYLRW